MALPQALVGRRGPAIVEAWFPAQEDGNIVADVLFGRVNPSGKLPVTIPFAGKGFLDQVQASQFPGTLGADGKTQTVTYAERLAIGYRWYDANVSGQCAVKQGRNPCVAFPFGHGLSYTQFRLGRPQLAADGGRWQVTVPVTNSGRRSGAQVVQPYVSLPAAANAIGAPQPPRRLIGFQRIELAAGASGIVSIPVDAAASNHPLGVWNETAKRWETPAGRYTLWAGTSSAPADLAPAGHIDR